MEPFKLENQNCKKETQISKRKGEEEKTEKYIRCFFYNFWRQFIYFVEGEEWLLVFNCF